MNKHTTVKYIRKAVKKNSVIQRHEMQCDPTFMKTCIACLVKGPLR